MPCATGLIWSGKAHSTYCTCLQTQIPIFFIFLWGLFSCCCQRDREYSSKKRENSIVPNETLQGEKFRFCGYGTVCVTTGIPCSSREI